MTDTGEPGRARPRKGYPAKRRAILRASRKVFGQVGNRGASIDEIVAKASVSTRTIYNHFVSKDELFATVVTDSTEQLARGQVTAHENWHRHEDSVCCPSGKTVTVGAGGRRRHP